MTMQNDLIFRLYESSDSELLARWIAGESWPFHGSERPSTAEVRQSIADGFYNGEDNRTFWIREGELPEPVGLICLHELTDDTPIFDLRLRSSARNRGIGRQALDWLARYVFTELEKRRIEGHTRVDNLPMRRVFLACGWVKEAHYRQAWPDSVGGYHDGVTYALLKSDWESGTSTPVNWDDEPEGTDESP